MIHGTLSRRGTVRASNGISDEDVLAAARAITIQKGKRPNRYDVESAMWELVHAWASRRGRTIAVVARRDIKKLAAQHAAVDGRRVQVPQKVPSISGRRILDPKSARTAKALLKKLEAAHAIAALPLDGLPEVVVEVVLGIAKGELEDPSGKIRIGPPPAKPERKPHRNIALIRGRHRGRIDPMKVADGVVDVVRDARRRAAETLAAVEDALDGDDLIEEDPNEGFFDPEELDDARDEARTARAEADLMAERLTAAENEAARLRAEDEVVRQNSEAEAARLRAEADRLAERLTAAENEADRLRAEAAELAAAPPEAPAAAEDDQGQGDAGGGSDDPAGDGEG